MTTLQKANEVERALISIVGEANILCPAPEAYAIDDRRPSFVVLPETSEEVAAVLRLAHAQDLAVVPMGSGRRLSFGNLPERVDILLSTRRMNRILEYEPADLTASLEAGCPLETFNRVALPYRQWLPFDPPDADRATVGGIAAADDFGPLRHGYGRPRDAIIGLEVAQADGTRIRAGGRVVKNVTGYDLNKLFVGSFGTLGIITRVNFKLRPLPEAEATLLFLDAAWETLASGAREILQSELLPAALLLANEAAMSPLGHGQKALLVRFLETAPAVAYQVERAKALAHSLSLELIELENEASRATWEKLSRLHRLIPTDLRLRLSVLPAHTVEALHTSERALSEWLDLPYLLAQPGTGIVHIGGKLGIESEADLPQVGHSITDLRTTWATRRGQVIVEHAPPKLKRHVDVWGDVGSSLPLMQALKRAFDPKRILSPGRFVAGL
ncbi:MAG: FAD-binding oxidoreductase [Blastocatellia bacterium]|nr:FAD-binding oxidoreductase [Blastocatellia bacterium]MDW8257111.1 FAD-binding oxidoreductase [Acidobacteriota bacterium]